MAKGSHVSWVRDFPEHPRTCHSCGLPLKITTDELSFETLFVDGEWIRRSWHFNCWLGRAAAVRDQG